MILYARKIGKLVLVPQLGIDEDKQALEQIQNYVPDCKVVGVPEGLENETCGRDYVILGHEYDSLEQAILDAYEVNQLRGEENKKPLTIIF